MKMEQKHIVLSALGMVAAGVGLISRPAVSRWRNSRAGEITEEQIEQELMKLVIDGRESKLTFDEFPYYLSKQTETLLKSAACVHLKQSDFSKHIRNLSQAASRAILLSGPTELYQQMLAEALAHYSESKLLLFDINDFSMKMQSKFGCVRNESSFKRSISEVTVDQKSSLVLSPWGKTRGSLRRQSSGLDIRSRGMKESTNHPTLHRNASAASDISNSASKSTSANLAPPKHSSSWCIDEKSFVQSLYKVLVSISKNCPIILYLEDFEEVLLQSKRLYKLLYRMFQKLPGSVLILGSEKLDPDDDHREDDD